ncbi:MULTISPECIES: ketopantoate reductase family protein [unclassified Novosphingobium]|uniref:ketopantoate reductase family protein n=1 Tax=unclassified Novosphingobium TaxID=2644732 RepID=UPI0019D67CC0|nr:MULTISPECIES: ketopantoate reductase family protein [unclassified Novosphingobium]MBF5092910.1 ketopantoate reductase family protein [Novosphingobium sp. NBM11]
MRMREVVIVGAGAMGCLFAAKLAESGVSVTLVDVDRARLEALARDGITLADDDGERRIPIAAKLASDVAGPVDLVLLFTKSMHSRSAIASVAHLVQASAFALTLQNGIGNAEAIAGVFPAGQVLLGVTDMPADLEGPARVSSHGHGTVRLGSYRPQGDDGAQAAVALLRGAGIDAHHDAAIEGGVWEKVAFNAALNSIATVTGLTVGGMDTPAGRRVAFAIAREVAATATAKGLSIDIARIEAKIDFALTHHRQHKASMLQDRLAGRRTEIEAINGAVAREAERLGVEVPVTATLADLVRLNEPV